MTRGYQETCCQLTAVGVDYQEFECVLHIHPKDVEELHLADRRKWMLLRGIPKADSPPEVRREKQGILIFLPDLEPWKSRKAPAVRLGEVGWAHWYQKVSRRVLEDFVEAAISEGSLSKELISEAANFEDVRSISTSNVRVERIEDVPALVIYPRECLILDGSLVY